MENGSMILLDTPPIWGCPASISLLEIAPELRLEPVSADIARQAGFLGEGMHGDPIDRIIVATARILKLKLVTADSRLRGADEVQAIW
jgi:PIN domain nuclease of toxin-antitoxin system